MANSYDEFSDMISSGVWYAEPKDVPSEKETNVLPMKKEGGRKCQSLNKA